MKGKRWTLFKLMSVLLVVVSMVTAFVLLDYNESKGWLMIIVTSLAAIGFLMMFLLSRSNLHRFLINAEEEIQQTEKDSLYSIPSPAVILDEHGIIIWYNAAFNDIIYDGGEAYGRTLDSILGADTERLRAKKSITAEINGSCFRLTAAENIQNEAVLTIVVFEDITELTSLRAQYIHTRPAVMIIMIDDYVDLLQNIKESDKASILVQIEKILETFMDDFDGILKKVSNDRFFAVIEEQHLERMIADKFTILDKARAITVNDRMCVTLSIGIGRGSVSLSQSEIFAKQALDMSLGRGGDQVAVKSENGFEFFGGVSAGIEKRTKVKARIISTALQELITESDRVLIMGHRLGDLDSVGAATGLCGAIHIMGVEAQVAVDKNRNLASPLIIRMNEQEDGIYITPEEAIAIADENTLLIIVDTSNPVLIESPELYEKCAKVVVIDHHRKSVNQIEGTVIFHHEPYASSASEMVAELVQYFPKSEELPPYFAEAMLAGITLDTKNFAMRTGVRTFEAAAFLKKLGADTLIVKGMFSSTIDSYLKKSKLVSSAEIYNRCAVAWSDSKNEDLRVVVSQAADDLLSISGVDASFVMYELDGTVNISARSMGTLNVHVIMEKLGGGGHQTMAATQLKNTDIASARKLLYKAIDEHMQNIS